MVHSIIHSSCTVHLSNCTRTVCTYIALFPAYHGLKPGRSVTSDPLHVCVLLLRLARSPPDECSWREMGEDEDRKDGRMDR